MSTRARVIRDVLLGKGTSRRNKLWLVGHYLNEGHFIEWQWQGPPYRSRLMFRFAPDVEFKASKSYEDDVFPLLEWHNPKVGA